MNKIIQDKCSCDEPISVELGRTDCRKDGKRPFYPDAILPKELDPKKYSVNSTTVLRCRKCSGWIGDTVKSACFNN